MQQLIRVPQNTISECSRLLNHWISSFASFAVHIAYIRECLETLRTREEALEDMYRRRESLDSKAESAWKKAGGLGDHPLFMGLSNELHAFDIKIANEKANLGDWKRIKGREWVGVLFGSLLECSERGTVVATLAQEIIGNLPTKTVQPGIPQAHTSGTSQIKSLVVKAERELDNISLVGRAGGEAELLFNENRTGGIPRHSPSHRIPPKVSSQQNTVVVDERYTNTRSRAHRNVGLVDHFRVHSPCSTLTVPTILVVGVVHPRFLPVTPYPRIMGQRHLSQKNPSLTGDQATGAPPTRMSSILSLPLF
jgi:hypothetical protein